MKLSSLVSVGRVTVGRVRAEDGGGKETDIEI